MIYCQLAGIGVAFDNRYKYMEAQCKDYLDESKKGELLIRVTKEEMEKEEKEFRRLYTNYPAEQPTPWGYLESICTYRNLAFALYAYDAYLMHACVVKVDENAYAFCARSGTGKTTHSRLWGQLLGDRMTYVNGDKPIIRFIDGVPYAFGTPWSGKEKLQNNICAPLKGIGIITRAKENHTVKINQDEAFFAMMHQILHPEEEEAAKVSLDLLNRTLRACNTYRIECNIEMEAAVVATNAMLVK